MEAARLNAPSVCKAAEMSGEAEMSRTAATGEPEEL